MARALLDAGVEVNTRNFNGDTPLLLAAGRGRVEAARLLLARGADPALAERDGWTALALAELKGHEELVELLKSGGRRGADFLFR